MTCPKGHLRRGGPGPDSGLPGACCRALSYTRPGWVHMVARGQCDTLVLQALPTGRDRQARTFRGDHVCGLLSSRAHLPLALHEPSCLPPSSAPRPLRQPSLLLGGHAPSATGQVSLSHASPHASRQQVFSGFQDSGGGRTFWGVSLWRGKGTWKRPEFEVPPGAPRRDRRAVSKCGTAFHPPVTRVPSGSV